MFSSRLSSSVIGAAVDAELFSSVSSWSVIPSHSLLLEVSYWGMSGQRVSTASREVKRDPVYRALPNE